MQTVTNLLAEFKGLLQDCKTVSESLQSDIAELKADAAGTATNTADIVKLKEDVAKLKEDVAKLKADVATSELRIDFFEGSWWTKVCFDCDELIKDVFRQLLFVRIIALYAGPAEDAPTIKTLDAKYLYVDHLVGVFRRVNDMSTRAYTKVQPLEDAIWRAVDEMSAASWSLLDSVCKDYRAVHSPRIEASHPTGFDSTSLRRYLDELDSKYRVQWTDGEKDDFVLLIGPVKLAKCTQANPTGASLAAFPVPAPGAPMIPFPPVAK